MSENKGIRVTFARPWTIGDDTYEPDKSYDITDPGVAEELLDKGYARPADDKPAAKTTSKGA